MPGLTKGQINYKIKNMINGETEKDKKIFYIFQSKKNF